MESTFRVESDGMLLVCINCWVSREHPRILAPQWVHTQARGCLGLGGWRGGLLTIWKGCRTSPRLPLETFTYLVFPLVLRFFGD